MVLELRHECLRIDISNINNDGDQHLLLQRDRYHGLEGNGKCLTDYYG
jgi:hypothetical protein